MRIERTTLDECIKEGTPFVWYRYPDEEKVHFLADRKGSIRVVSDLSHLNGLKGFVMAPFGTGKETPIVVINADEWIGEKQEDESDYITSDNMCVSSSRMYAECFNVFSKALKQRDYEKLVLSRCLAIDRPDLFSPYTAFMNAVRMYPHSFVYLLYTPLTGIWIGSTPELLLSGKEGQWHTMALAGTQLLQDGKLPDKWDEKNKKEQEYVAAYIRKQLTTFNVEFRESEPHSAFAGTLSHLCTDFYFSLKDTTRLGDLLALLHPTPAVCGLPKEEAYQFILAHEGYDRSYYSGFIGMLHPDFETKLYVNLRCMKVEKHQLKLYAGGGLLESSSLEDEWLETENKMRMMKRVITH